VGYHGPYRHQRASGILLTSGRHPGRPKPKRRPTMTTTRISRGLFAIHSLVTPQIATVAA
jgi:hypothetical protein